MQTNSLKKDIANGDSCSTQQFIERARDAGKELADSATEAAKDVSAAVSDFTRPIVKQGKDSIDGLEHYVRSNPIRCVLAGTLMGLLLGRVMRN